MLGLSVILLLFGELDHFVRPRYQVTLNTEHAAGLRRGSAVELNGVPIGVIDDVIVRRPGAESSNGFPVRVIALIDRDITIPDDVRPLAASSLLGGSAVLEFDTSHSDAAAAMLPRDGTARIDRQVRKKIFAELSQELDARMKPLVAAIEPFRVLGTDLGRLLVPQTAADAAVAPNLRTRLERAVTATEVVLEDVSTWLGDETMRTDVRGAVTSARTLVDDASRTLETLSTRATHSFDRLDAVAGTIEGSVNDLSARAVPVADRLAEVTDQLALTLEEVRGVARLATEGDGTLSLLLHDPDLYRSLEDAIQQLDLVQREVRLTLQQYRAEGLKLDLF